jgi:carbon-monoxide dehydrogenase iron sulfur subunit
MQGIIMVDPDKCTGCRMCELICSATKEGEFLPSKARIKVFSKPRIGISIPMVCLQCEDPVCEMVCQFEAIKRDGKTGLVETFDNKCTGCSACVLACPFGAIEYDKSQAKLLKCDLCNGEPLCVKVCYSKAIEYKEVAQDVLIQRRRNLAQYSRYWFPVLKKRKRKH